MATKKSTIDPKQTFEQKLDRVERVIDDMVFAPTDAQLRVKSAFWMRMRENPTLDPDSVTAQDVAEVTRDSRVTSWWSTAGFRTWFLNSKSIEERMEYLLDRWVDSVYCILEDEDPKSFTAKINLGKLLVDITGRAPATRKEVKVLDTTIPNTKEELEEFLRQSNKLSVAK